MRTRLGDSLVIPLPAVGVEDIVAGNEVCGAAVVCRARLTHGADDDWTVLHVGPKFAVGTLTLAARVLGSKPLAITLMASEDGSNAGDEQRPSPFDFTMRVCILAPEFVRPLTNCSAERPNTFISDLLMRFNSGPFFTDFNVELSIFFLKGFR
jgi:hypothetical protein